MTEIIGNLLWTTPMMLAGLVLIAIPLIAHLLNRNARREFVVPTLHFLQQCVTEQNRFLRFRRLLLLLLRTIAIALIVFAFARPLWFAEPTATVTGESVAMAVVLDASLSTQQSSGAGQLFANLKGLAGRAIDELQPGRDLAAIIVAQQKPSSLFRQLSPNLPGLKERLLPLNATYERADLTGAVALAAEKLSGHDGRRILVVVSDMQRTNWKEALQQAQKTLVLPSGTDIRFLNVESAVPENYALSDPNCSPPDPADGQSCLLSVKVANFSERAKQVPVMLNAGKLELDRRNIQLDAGESTSVTFTLKYDSAMGTEFTFVTEGDAMTADNRSYLAMTQTAKTPVAVISDDPIQELGSSSFFLQRVLEPFKNSSDRFNSVLISPADVPARLSPDQFKIACVGYVAAWDSKSAKALVSFVELGGRLVYLCGEGNVANATRTIEAAAGKTFFPYEVSSLDRYSKFEDFPYIDSGKWRSRWLRDFDLQSQLALAADSISKTLARPSRKR